MKKYNHYIFSLFLLVLIFIFTSIFDAYSQDRRPRRKKTKSNSKPLKNTRKQFTIAGFDYKKRRLKPNEKFEFGINLGSGNSLTDIGGTKEKAQPLFFDVQFSKTTLSPGFFVRYRFKPYYAVSGGFDYIKLSGDDKLSPVGTGRYNRGKNFKNNVLELNVKNEFYFAPFTKNSPLDFYIYLGIAGIYHKPILNDDKIDIYDNPNADYNNMLPVIPMGIGFKSKFSYFIIGYEVGWRKTFTDYLDGFTRPFSKGNDSYFVNSLKFSMYMPQFQKTMKYSKRKVFRFDNRRKY